MYQVDCIIEGMVHVMFDRFYNPADTERPAKKKGKNAWKDELPKKLYFDEKGVYCPVDNIRMMLIGNKHRVGAAKILGSFIETKKATQYLSFCKGLIWVVGPDDPQKVYFEPHRDTYDDYDERSFINAAGSRSLTRRPILKTPWSLNFIVQVMDDQYDYSKVKEFFDVAGIRCGLGAYGPTFGRFLVTKWELKKNQRDG